MILSLFRSLSLASSQRIIQIRNKSIEIIHYDSLQETFPVSSMINIARYNICVGTYVMQQWRHRSNWNLFHVGIIFKSEDSHYVLDYNARRDDDILDFISPRFTTGIETTVSIITTYLQYSTTREDSLTIDNWGQLRLVNKLPDEYTDMTVIASVSNLIFRDFRKWALWNWSQPANRFDIFTVVSQNGSKTILRAKICHDFVQDSLLWLKQNNVTLYSETNLSRDSIVIYAESVTPVDWNIWRDRRDFVRFMRFFSVNWKIFSQSFFRSREFAAKLKHLGMRLLISNDGNFYWINFGDGLVNYCRKKFESNWSFDFDRFCYVGQAATGDPFTLTISDYFLIAEIQLDTFLIFLFSFKILEYYVLASSIIILVQQMTNARLTELISYCLS